MQAKAKAVERKREKDFPTTLHNFHPRLHTLLFPCIFHFFLFFFLSSAPSSLHSLHSAFLSFIFVCLSLHVLFPLPLSPIMQQIFSPLTSFPSMHNNFFQTRPSCIHSSISLYTLSSSTQQSFLTHLTFIPFLQISATIRGSSQPSHHPTLWSMNPTVYTLPPHTYYPHLHFPSQTTVVRNFKAIIVQGSEKYYRGTRISSTADVWRVFEGVTAQVVSRGVARVSGGRLEMWKGGGGLAGWMSKGRRGGWALGWLAGWVVE